MAGSALPPQKIDDFRQRRARSEDARHAHFQELGRIALRDDAADQDTDVLEVRFAEKRQHARNQGQVSAAENAQTKPVGVLVRHRPNDGLRRLPQPRVDHMHAGVAQSPGDHFDAAVMAVETNLGQHHADESCGSRHMDPRSLARVADPRVYDPPLNRLPFGRTLVAAEHVRQGVHELPDRAAHVRRLQKGRHQVLTSPGHAAHFFQRTPDYLRIALLLGVPQGSQLFLFHRLINAQGFDGLVFRFLKGVDTHQNLPPRIDLALISEGGVRNLAAEEAALNRLNHAALLLYAVKILTGLLLHLPGQGLDEITTSHRINSV